MLQALNVLGTTDKAFSEEKPDRQLQIVARSAHRHRHGLACTLIDCPIYQTNLKRLLHDHPIVVLQQVGAAPPLYLHVDHSLFEHVEPCRMTAAGVIKYWHRFFSLITASIQAGKREEWVLPPTDSAVAVVYFYEPRHPARIFSQC